MVLVAAPIAIVGIAAELPSGDAVSKNFGHSDFFQFLLAKGESYENVPSNRFNWATLHGEALGQVFPAKGSFLKNLDQFDYSEFGITPKDAQHMSVATRKLIETTFLSLLDSGINYRGRNVGCYMAGVSHDLFAISGQDEYEARGSFAGLPSMIANRISYHLDLRGPSVPVDTACSSSLVALHLAVQALRAGECESAVVGGAQINLRFIEWANYSQGGIVSAEGKCKPFDVDADGFARGEGVVTIVLKPLEAALRDGDRIYGSILGSAINSTGSVAPVSAPVAAAQQAAMEAALEQTGRSPQDVDFLELHATGTSRGDPTEANWVGHWFKRSGEILVGSVKGNIGHLEITAFLASLSKVVSMFETGLIPPTANLTTPNPAIKWEEYRLHAPTTVTSLSTRGSRALVAMTSSGIGGANGSCIVEGPPAPTASRGLDVEFWSSDADYPRLFVCGGLSPRTVSTVTETLLQQRQDGVDEAALSLTYGRRARSMPWLNYAIALPGESMRFTEPILSPKARGALVFVFSGQGPQHLAMGRELFRASNVFRESVLKLDNIYERTTGHSLILKYGLFDGLVEPESLLNDIWPIAVTLPALTIVQVALFDTLRFLGLKPDFVVGHSAGETATLYASGAASKEMTIQLSIARGRGLTPLEHLDCSMAAVNCSPVEAEGILTRVANELGPGSLEIGCYNSAEALTLSGANPNLARAVEVATELGFFARKLKTRVAVHSSMMEHCRETYCNAVNEVFAHHTLSKPTVAICSAATGEIMEAAGDADYFWSNSRGPVRFSQAIQTLVKAHPNASFVEVGPHPVLASYISSLVGSHATVTCPLQRPNPKKPTNGVELRSFLITLARLAVAGVHANYAFLSGSKAPLLRDLPAYPFQSKSVPVCLPSQQVKRFTRQRNGPLNFRGLCVNSQTHPSLADHLIKATPIMPAAGYIEMALEFGARRLWNIKLVSMLGLTSSRPTSVQVLVENGYWTVKSSSSHMDIDDDGVSFDRLHAEGMLSTEVNEDDRSPVPLDVAEARARCKSFDVSRLYDDIKHFADYGERYRRIVDVRFNDDEALVEVRALTSDVANDPAYVVHPAVLDAAIHAAIHPVMTGNRDPQLYFLPASVRSFTVHDHLLLGLPEVVVSHLTRRSWTPRFVEFDCAISTITGTRLCTLEGLGIEQHGASVAEPLSTRYELVYRPTDVALLVRDHSSPGIAPNNSVLAMNGDSGLLSSEPPRRSPYRILTYRRGEELLIQQEISTLHAWDTHTFWFIGSKDDEGAFGFTRSLRREYPSWTVNLVLFDASWSLPQIQSAVAEIANNPDGMENELVVDSAGRVLVPRLVFLSDPSQSTSFNPSRAWALRQNKLVHVDRPLSPVDNHRLVVLDVLALADGYAGLREFIGCDAETGKTFMGVTDSSLSNFAVVHRQACVALPDDIANARDAPSLLAVAIIALAFGAEVFEDPHCLWQCLRSNATVIVTHSETTVGLAISMTLSSMGVNVNSLRSSHDLSRLTPGHASAIISAYTDTTSNRALACALEEDGNFTAWTDPLSGLRSQLQKKPWLVGRALRASVVQDGITEVVRVAVHPPLHFVKDAPVPGQQILSVVHLFDPRKAYLLIGGIGSLGVDVACWMYENGARHLVLTSRSGGSSLEKRGDKKSLRMLAYLETLPDLDMRLVAVDATSVDGMSALITSIKHLPIGGCMLLAVTLVDRLFTKQDKTSFELAFAPKVGAMIALECCVDVSSLDFLLSFSSVSALFGNGGQTNYAAANTALEGKLRHMRNACSIVVPAMIDSSVATEESHSRLRHLTDFGFTSRKLCACLEDAIRRLADDPISVYVPDFDWNIVNARMGPSPMFQHLVMQHVPLAADGDETAFVEEIVIQQLDVSRADLSLDVPLTSYGLDSLSAARLVHALRNHVSLTQLQLLSDMSINDVYRRMESASLSEPGRKLQTQALFDWSSFNELGRPVVKCIDSNDPSDVPLIIMAGTSGNGLAFSPLQTSLRTSFWFLQVTPDTPCSSMETFVGFYRARIKELRPRGPYRFATYSGTDVIAVELVHAFEDAGDVVVQFVFIDHVPTMFCTPDLALDEPTLRSGTLDEATMKRWFWIMLDTYNEGNPVEVQFRAELEASWAGATTTRKVAQDYCLYFRRLVAIIVAFNISLVPTHRDRPDAFMQALHEALSARVRSLRTPKAVWYGSAGMVVASGESVERWGIMGFEPEHIFQCAGSHRSIFFEEEFSRGLELGWSM